MRPLFGVRRRIGIRVARDGEFGESHDGVDFLPECRILLDADRAAFSVVGIVVQREHIDFGHPRAALPAVHPA